MALVDNRSIILNFQLILNPPWHSLLYELDIIQCFTSISRHNCRQGIPHDTASLTRDKVIRVRYYMLYINFKTQLRPRNSDTKHVILLSCSLGWQGCPSLKRLELIRWHPQLWHPPRNPHSRLHIQILHTVHPIYWHCLELAHSLLRAKRFD